MDHDLGFCGEVRVFDPCGGGVQEVGYVVVGTCAAQGPQQAGADLVADGDDGGGDGLGGVSVADVEGVVVECILEGFDAAVVPLARCGLV